MSRQPLFFCPRWGSEHLDWNAFAWQVKNAGYDGMEVGIARTVARFELEEIFAVAARHQLLVIAQQYDTSESNVNEHCRAFGDWFEKIKPYKPLFVNSQTGKDFFTMEENQRVFSVADDYTKQTGISVYHETHRNKCLFAAHVAKTYLKAMPALQITLDMSHWVCVASSLLEDQSEAMQLAATRTQHIHARIGYTEGAQVTDPFAPEWKSSLNAHLCWWDAVVARKSKENTETITITPEFGAFPYMLYLPGTLQPIASQWDINVKMMKLLKERYV